MTFEGGADFTDAKFVCFADFSNATIKGIGWFVSTDFKEKTTFKNATFERNAWFEGAIFRREARFEGATFKNHAVFGSGTLNGNEAFPYETFENFALFGGSTFKDFASFKGSTFEREAWFGDVTFEDAAQFDLTKFSGYATFYNVDFYKDAAFISVHSTSAFSLNRTTFRSVPNFEQAHFDEAPRLDHLMIEPQSSIWAKWRKRWFDYRKHGLGYQDYNRPAHWRSLKRLAVQAHDHAREQDFFRREMIARRFMQDRPWHAVFWAGLVYQVLSDFGRSIFRPLFWLLISTAIFAGFYLGAYFNDEQHISSLSWYIERTKEVIGIGAAPELSCITGPGSPPAAALHLSISKTLLLPAIGTSESLNTTYACLYGVDTARTQPKGQLIPPFRVRSPESVIALSMLQSLISAVLLFLLLLSIRNHFRIK